MLQDLLENREEDALLVQVDQEQVASVSNGGDDKGGEVKATVRAVAEEEGDEDVERGDGKLMLSEKAKGKRKVRKRGAKASYELSGRLIYSPGQNISLFSVISPD